MFLTTTSYRTVLQRQLDRESRRDQSDDEAAEFCTCPSQTEEAAVADRPLLARTQFKDGGGSNLPRGRDTIDDDTVAQRYA